MATHRDLTIQSALVLDSTTRKAGKGQRNAPIAAHSSFGYAGQICILFQNYDHFPNLLDDAWLKNFFCTHLKLWPLLLRIL